MLNLGMNMQRLAVKGGLQFTPASLFNNGEAGVWYDPSDITTLYQDYQGATPVTAVGEPVGLMLDKSKGLAQGPELVTNGDFATDSGWTKEGAWNISNGSASITSSLNDRIYQSASLDAAKTYLLSVDVLSISSASVRFRFGSNGSAGNLPEITTTGTHTFISKPLSGTSSFGIFAVSGATASIDNVSVKEIQGSHATQPTSTKRPIYARHPEGGIRNLFNYTEQFDNGYWTKQDSTITANAVTAPDGTQTADNYAHTSGNAHLSRTTAGLVNGDTYTASIYVKKNNNRWYRFSSSESIFSVWFDLDNGVVGTTTGTSTSTITNVGNGWYRCTCTFAVANTAHTFYMMNAIANGSSAEAAGNAAYIWGAQFEKATEASNYQKVVTDIDVTESGVGEVYYLKFDGTDDGMAINNLTSGITALTALFGYSAVGSNPSGGKYLLDVQTGRIVFVASTGTPGHIGYFDGQWSEFAADSDAIKVLTYDLVENDAKIRIDGTQEYSDTTYVELSLGGNIGLFGNYPVTGSFLAGNMYQTILRAAESTDEEIAKAETYVANKTGLKAQVDGIATLDLNFGANLYTAKNSNGGVI